MSSFLPPRFFQIAYVLDAYAGGAMRAARRRLGLGRPLRILPYRGYGTPARALVKARVLEDNHVPPPRAHRTLAGSAFASYKRFATVEVPRVAIRIRWGDSIFEGKTDEEGFFDQWVLPPEDSPPGWHEVHLELADAVDGPRAAVKAPVLLVDRSADYGVISDIDDTVIVTDVRNLLKRAWALLMSEASRRLPFEGVSGFYSALRAGPSGKAHNPIFYVSSSPWNLYEHLEHLLTLHGIPSGPLLLRDWGLTREGFAPGGGHGHKLEKIRDVLDTFPTLSFILIGDSGQQDPEHYTAVALEHPGRILAIYIRDVTAHRARKAQLEALAARTRGAGTELVIVPDTVSAARHASNRGLVHWREVEEVRIRHDEDASSA